MDLRFLCKCSQDKMVPLQCQMGAYLNECNVKRIVRCWPDFEVTFFVLHVQAEHNTDSHTF